MLVLVVEDDLSYAEIISYSLQRAGHEVVSVSTIRDAVTFIRRKPPHLAVLDVSLPDGNGLTLCASLRDVHASMPILMLSGLDRSSDIVAGLEAGADDYLTKPFHPTELVARVNALARRAGLARTEAGIGARLSADGFAVDPDSLVAQYKGVDLGCTKIEIDILGQLVRYPGQALTHSFLTEAVWGYKNLSDATLLKGHISSLRRKIKLAGGDPEIVRTVHGVGYSFSPH